MYKISILFMALVMGYSSTFAEANHNTLNANNKGDALASTITTEEQRFCMGKDGASIEQRLSACAKIIQQSKADPKSKVAALVNHGRALHDKSDFEAAISDYNEALKIDAAYIPAWRARGNSFRKQGDYDKAIEDFSQAVKLDPNSAESYNDRGLAYYQKRENDRAIGDFEKAVALDRWFAVAFKNRAAAYGAKGDEKFQNANNDYVQSLMIARGLFWNSFEDPFEPAGAPCFRVFDGGRRLVFSCGVRYGVARELEQMFAIHPNIQTLELQSPGGNLYEAERMALFIRARGVDTYVADHCASACTLVFVSGKNRFLGPKGRLGFHLAALTDGSKTSRSVSKMQLPQYVQLGFKFSQPFLQKVLNTPNKDVWYPTLDELKAENIVTQAVAADRFASVPPAGLKEPRYFQKEISDQITSIQQAIMDDPRDINYLSKKLFWYWDLKDYEEALIIAQEALELSPDNMNLLEGISNIYEAKGDFETALKTLGQALALYSDNPDLYKARAELWQDNRDYVRALTDLDHAITLDPKDNALWHNRCRVRLLNKQAAEALGDCDQAMRLDDEEAGTHNVRGFVLLALNRSQEAFEAFEKALKLSSKDSYAFYGRGVARKNIGGQEELATSDLTSAYMLFPDIEIELAKDVGFTTPPPLPAAIAQWQVCRKQPKKDCVINHTLRLVDFTYSTIKLQQDCYKTSCREIAEKFYYHLILKAKLLEDFGKHMEAYKLLRHVYVSAANIEDRYIRQEALSPLEKNLERFRERMFQKNAGINLNTWAVADNALQQSAYSSEIKRINEARGDIKKLLQKVQSLADTPKRNLAIAMLHLDLDMIANWHMRETGNILPSSHKVSEKQEDKNNVLLPILIKIGPYIKPAIDLYYKMLDKSILANIDRTFEDAKNTSDPKLRSDKLLKIALVLRRDEDKRTEFKNFGEYILQDVAITPHIKSSDNWGYVLRDMVKLFAQEGRFDDALKATTLSESGVRYNGSFILKEQFKKKAFIEIGKVLALVLSKEPEYTSFDHNDYKFETPEDFSSFWSAALSFSPEPVSFYALSNLAKNQISAGHSDDILQRIKQIPDEKHRDAVLLSLMRYFTNEKKFSEGKKFALAITDKKVRDDALIILAIANTDFAETMELVSSISDENKREIQMTNAVVNTISPKDLPLAYSVLPKLKFKYAQTRLFLGIATTQAQNNEPDKAMEAIRQVPAGYYKSRDGVFSSIAMAYVKAGRYAEGIVAALSIDDRTNQVKTLGALAVLLPEH